jgi:RNA recognition motif-containing protein
MAQRVYVGNLPPETSERDLEDKVRRSWGCAGGAS